MSTILNTKNLRYVPVINRNYDDAVVLPVVGLIDFSQDTSFVLDLSTVPQTQKLINQIESVFVQGPLTVTDNFAVQLTSLPFSFRFKPPFNGWMPLPMPRNQYVVTLINSSGTLEPSYAPFNLFFANFPQVAFEQNLDPLTNASVLGVTVQNTPLPVTVPTPLPVNVNNTPLPVTVQNPVTNVNPAVYSNAAGSANVNAPLFVGNQCFQRTITASSGTIIPAVAGWGWYLTGLWVQPSPGAAIATAGPWALGIIDSVSSSYLMWASWALPTSGNANYAPAANAPGFFYNSKVAASSLLYTMTPALTSGSVQIIANYGYQQSLLNY